MIDASPPLLLTPNCVVDERYELVRSLGSGAMGSVFLAIDRVLDGNLVAIKFLYPHLVSSPGSLERFHNEVLVARKLIHPHIVRTFNLGTGEYPYLTMEYVDGSTLKQQLKTEYPTGMSSDLALRIFLQVACAVRYSHRRGIIHRDLKPENILMGESGAKVGDFGLAATIRRETQITRVGQVLGTPSYMAPERFRGMAPGVQSDIYSLGILLYELLTGSVPFEDRSLYGLAQQHATTPLPRPTKFRDSRHECMWMIAARCAEKKPEDRYSDISMVFQELEAQVDTTDPLRILLDEPSVSSTIAPVPELDARKQDASSRSQLFWTLLIGFVIGSLWARNNTSAGAVITVPVLIAERYLGTEFTLLRQAYRLDIDGPPRPLTSVLGLNTRALYVRLLAGDDPNAQWNKGEKGQSVLHVTVKSGNIDQTELLLSYGADIEALDDEQNTPLMVAVSSGIPELVELLLNHGANPNRWNKLGQLPLVVAVRRLGQTEGRGVVGLLLRHGADPLLIDGSKRSALAAAAESANTLQIFRRMLRYVKDFDDQHLATALAFTPEDLKEDVRQLWEKARLKSQRRPQT